MNTTNESPFKPIIDAQEQQREGWVPDLAPTVKLTDGRLGEIGARAARKVKEAEGDSTYAISMLAKCDEAARTAFARAVREFLEQEAKQP